MRKLVLSTAAALLLATGAARAAEGEVHLPKEQWSWDGLFGTYDQAALQRGFQVYKDVCSACHSMNLVAYRNLEGIGLNEDQQKAVAASVQITDGPNDEGEMFERPGVPSDYFKPPFPNDQAARAANNGALPPDLSLMCKARVGGADYIHALMTGYVEPPAGFKVNEGMNYNEYFVAGAHQIAMPPPLSDGAVTYADGTQATVDQMAHDVATFLCWTAEPKLEERKQMGVKTILFLVVLAGMLYATKRKIWSDVH